MIEDEPNDAELSARSLRGAGFDVTWERVERLDEVRAALGRSAYDVILSDHSMPGFTSADVLDLIAGVSPLTPLIIVSGAIGEGEVVDLLHRGAASYVDKGSLKRLGATIERAMAQARLQRDHIAAKRKLDLVQAAVNGANDLFCILEAGEYGAPAIVYANEAAERITGYTPAELIARGFDGSHGPDTDPAAAQRLATGIALGEPITVELLHYRKDGSTHWVESRIRPLEAGSSRFVCVSRDITERKTAEQQLSFLAMHDSLTRLANRALLRERLDHEIAQARRSLQQVAVLLLDLDGFKDVNDSLGHAFGDDLLREIAQRLRSSVREIDTVARLGGDEFVVVIGSADGDGQIAIAAQRILESIRRPVRLASGVCNITVSIGISTFPSDGANRDQLLAAADGALYRVKATGKDGFHFYEQNIDKSVKYT